MQCLHSFISDNTRSPILWRQSSQRCIKKPELAKKLLLKVLFERAFMKFNVTKRGSSATIQINEAEFVAGKHWFWEKFSENWEAETQNFFTTNIVRGTDCLDLGGWIGITAMMATALGARRVDILEPNPMNFMNLLATQLSNENLLKSWCLSNSCISDSDENQFIGPFPKIFSSASSSRTSSNEVDGVEIPSLTLSKFRENKRAYSLIKIDIEGGEQFILKDLHMFGDSMSAIWLSLHPAILLERGDDIEFYAQEVARLSESFYITDGNNFEIDTQTVKERVLSKEARPTWGTEWGNLFEIGLLPKCYFTRISADEVITRKLQ